MIKELKSPNISLTPKSFIHLIMTIGLIAFTWAIVQQKIIIALGIAATPLLFAMLGYGFQQPYFIYCIYATYSFSLNAIMRYTHVDKLSALLDALVFFALISIMCTAYKRGLHVWKRAINVLSISYLIWIGFTLFQFTNPYTNADGINFGLRYWIVGTILLYIVLSILSDNFKVLKIGINLIAIFIIIAFIKLLIQKYIGFDSAERYYLYVQGAKSTHILGSGIRYFSFFSDAATFGTLMGIGTFVYSLIGFNNKDKTAKIYYLFIASISLFGLLLSGTRGALIIPIGGLALYTLLCKNFKVFIVSSIVGISIFVFFAFTNIGNGNQFIRRARTAFTPSKDASMDVRLVNREIIAEYIARHPMGAGLANMVPIVVLNNEGNYVKDIVPPDSYFVWIWSQTGYVGLFLFLAIHILVLLRCCYIILFNVKNHQLQQILAAFTCAVFGIWLSGYTSYSPGQPPINFLTPAMIAFVMNGKFIDEDIIINHNI